MQYPEERSPLPENYRNFPFLIYDTDDADAGLRCVACKICEKECPPQCIYIVKSEDKKPDYMGKPQFYPAVFDIDISVCMSCQICVEVCPFEAIKMDKVFELSTRERFDALLQRKGELSKSNTYYHSIHPIEAAEVDAQAGRSSGEEETGTRSTESAAGGCGAFPCELNSARETAGSSEPGFRGHGRANGRRPVHPRAPSVVVTGLGRLVVARERHAEFVAYTSFVYELERMMVWEAACGLE